MKVVILAGGLGTRLGELTEIVPKPLVKIGNLPIIHHIMNIFYRFGHSDFYIATGYKSEQLKEYFRNFQIINFDFKINLASGHLETYNSNVELLDWNVSLFDTGVSTMTGGRLKRLKQFIGHESFMLTYGDGLADINLSELLSFHRSHGKMITVTAVRPPARFGELELCDTVVRRFVEKPQLHQGWINGGFFVLEPAFFDLIDGDSTMLEREPLERAAQMGELMAYQHHGFWQCMDTKRDRDSLESVWASGRAPWSFDGARTQKSQASISNPVSEDI